LIWNITEFEIFDLLFVLAKIQNCFIDINPGHSA